MLRVFLCCRPETAVLESDIDSNELRRGRTLWAQVIRKDKRSSSIPYGRVDNFAIICLEIGSSKYAQERVNLILNDFLLVFFQRALQGTNCYIIYLIGTLGRIRKALAALRLAFTSGRKSAK